MHITLTNVNDACPKNCYHLSSIDQLVDATMGFRLMSFLYDYSNYTKSSYITKTMTRILRLLGRGNFVILGFLLGIRMLVQHIIG